MSERNITSSKRREAASARGKGAVSRRNRAGSRSDTLPGAQEGAANARAPGSHYGLTVQQAIQQLALAGDTARVIRADVVKSYGEANVPALRTVQTIIAAVRRDRTAPWELTTENGADARYVLPVLSAVLEQTKGRARVTRGEASWIVTLAAAAQDLADRHPWMLYMLAAAAAAGDDIVPIRDFLAFAPWRDTAHAARYAAAVEAGFVARATRQLAMLGYIAREPEGVVAYRFMRSDPQTAERVVLIPAEGVVELRSGGWAGYSREEESK